MTWVADVLADDHVARYVDGWDPASDVGVIACTDDGAIVGAAWTRALNVERPGYGYLADDVPEVSIGVEPPWRGAGVGGRLLSALVERCRARGIERLSLSVEADNPAQRLYRRHGFVVVDRVEGSLTMCRELLPGR